MISDGSPLPRLADIVEASERLRLIVEQSTLKEFESDWQRQWLVERGVEIISEASRHLPDTLKQRHPPHSVAECRGYRQCAASRV